nr:Frizzled and Frizzled protein domain containing protein [Haemonchus contortus]
MWWSSTVQISLVLIIVFDRQLYAASIFDQTSKGKCQPIEIPLCKEVPYNYTYFPNPYLQQDQQSLQTNTEHFKPLIKTKCNRNIQFFVCSVFAPMCPEGMPQAVTSCRSVCEQVKADCSSILEEFGISWPEPLDCSRFPQEPDLCMNPDEDRHSYEKTSSVHRHRLRPSSLSCPHDLIDIDPLDNEGVCAYKCGADVMFSSEEKAAARTWMIMWGGFDFSISLFTFLTFLIERNRFRFPERCVFYISLCFMLYSIPYLFPLIMQYSARACDKLINGQSYLVFSGFENTNCLFSFVFTYYFGTASCLWWLMFAFTWYLSASRKWVPEGIDACSSYLHLVAWGTAALMTIVVLVMQRVDASELSGICSVGNTDPTALLAFSLIPRSVFVFFGTCFVIAGFASMCRERDSFRRRGTDTSKLDKLMFKMGLFCLLYIFPAVTQILCDIYAYNNVKRWYPTTIACKSNGGVESGHCHRPHLPQAEIYHLSLMMSLAVGASCGMWVLSPKTLMSWHRVLCCGMCRAAPQKPTTTTTTTAAATRPLLEPPTAPPPHPPSHYVPMSSHGQNAWRPSKVV